jgi:hypothetical protein
MRYIVIALILIIFGIAIVLSFNIFRVVIREIQAPTPTKTSESGTTKVTQKVIYVTPTITQGMTVKVAMISPKDGGPIGCGDYIEMVDRTVKKSSGVLKAAYEELLSIKEMYLGNSAIYNSLYQSNLKVDSVQIENGTAIIHLSGSLQLNGECDNPRVKAQLEETAKQFDTVKETKIFINDKTIDEAISLK